MKSDLISSAWAPVCLCLTAGLSLSLSLLQPSPAAADPVASPAAQTSAAGDGGKDGALRVCASANQAPFSERGGGGFENKIADAVASAMGRSVDFVWTDKPAIYLVRDFLDKKACDVIVGLDTGDPRVLTTKPYYKAGYVFITKASETPDIHSWKDPRLKTFEHIAVESGTPAEMMLKQIGKYDDEFNYEKSLVNFKSSRNQYVQVSPERLVSEVAGGKAQVAVGFAPEVARYVREASPPLKMTPVDNDTFMTNGTPIPESFDQSMGVRKGDTKLLAKLNEALVKAKPQIDQILNAEGIPLSSS